MPKSSGRFNSLIVPLVTWLVLLIPFAIYQRFYVRSQEAYFTEHGFRLLTAVGRQLNSYLDSISKTVNAAKRESLEKAKLGEVPSKAYENYLGNFLPDLALLDLAFLKKAPDAAKVFSVEFGPRPPVFERKFEDVPISGRLSLDAAIRERLSFGEDYFDDVVIANTKGEVLFQRSENTRITNLNHLVSAVLPAPAAKQQEDSKSNREAPSFATLSEFSNTLEVKLAGDDYKLFVQPFQLASAEAEAGGEAPNGEKLVVCGLWRTERLNSDSFALPYSSVIWFGLFCAAAGSFVWPFLKIKYMSRTERLRRIHGWMLVLSMFLGATSATLMVLNATYSSDVERNVDQDLASLSGRIQENLKRELGEAVDQLADLSGDSKVEELARQPWKPQVSILGSLENRRPESRYPYFDIAFWADEGGKQLAKYSVDRNSTPETNVKTRPFFKAVVAARDSTTPVLAKVDDHRYSLQPLVSPNTGLFSTVIAAPYEKGGSNIKVQALVFRPLSLVNPVLPPNFGFAVLARDGTVLFHSNPLRNLSENFVQECKDPSAVQSALFSNPQQNLDIAYSGKDRRAQVSKLDGLGPEPATLVVFHNTEINRTVNLAIILIVSVLMGGYTAIILLVAVIDLLYGATYPPKWIWPRRECTVRYVLVFFGNGVLVLAFLLFYSVLWELGLLALTAGVFVFGVSWTAVMLLKKELPIAHETWNRTLQPWFKITYVAAAVSLLVVVTMVPCFGFFKFSHDAASELAAKHGQLTIFNELLDRDSRISNYYLDLKAPKRIAVDRRNEDLDRYDTLDLAFLSFHPDDKPIDARDEHDGPLQQGFDDWLTWATRLFPSNRLGREMRMLHFDSSDSVHAKWSELDHNVFRLRIGDNLPVDSKFAEWPGVGFGGWIWLGLLWLVVGCWFFLLMKEIFLPDSQSPVPLDHVNWQTCDEITENYLVLSEPQFGKSSCLAGIAGIQCVDLRVELEHQGPQHFFENAIVALDHFDFGMDNRLHNQTRLQLLERLLYKDHCRVVLVSAVDPVYYLSEGDPAILADNPQAAAESLGRWTKVMSAFRAVTFEDSSQSAFDEQMNPHREDPKLKRLVRWIEEECGHTAYLRDLGLELFSRYQSAQQFDLQTLRNELADRSDSYYSLLWSALTSGERLTLYQLAKDGWANSKNDRAIRQLQRKGFIHSAPMFRMMNDSFRFFVLKAQDQREIAEWERQGAQSSWRTLKFSLVAAAVGLAAWLFYAQKDLFQGAIGYVLTLAAAVTAIANVLGSIKGHVANVPKAPETGP